MVSVAGRYGDGTIGSVEVDGAGVGGVPEGSTVARRDVFRGKVWTAAPYRVIRDVGTGLVLACCLLPTNQRLRDNSQGLQPGGAYPFVFSHCPVSGFWSISQDAMLNPPLALAWLMTLPLTLISHCTDPLPWSCASIA